MVRNKMSKVHLALATGDDAGAGAGLTAWRNADAAYIAGELKPTDQLISWKYTAPVYERKEIGVLSTSMVNKKVDVLKKPGLWESRHALQTCQFIWWLMQTAATPTNEGTPTSYNTHTLTISSAETPLWHGLHFEDESISSQEIRHDMMGFLPNSLSIECGQSPGLWRAVQDIKVPFANRVAGSDIAKQTERPGMTVGTKWKTWRSLLTGSCVGKTPTTFTYNDAQVEVEIKRIKLNLMRGITWGIADANDILTSGFLNKFNYNIQMDVHPIGDNLHVINDTKPDDYAGDLDYSAIFIADATNDKITMTYDKLYMLPFSRENDWKKYIEGYTITLVPYFDTSSLAVVGIDGLDNTHFENP